MSFRDFVREHFPLAHPRPLFKKKNPKKRRETISGFHKGDRVQHIFDGTLGVVQRVHGLDITVRLPNGCVGCFFAHNWRLVNP